MKRSDMVARQNVWKNRCDPAVNGNLPIPSVKKLFQVPNVELCLFHGGGSVNINVLPLGAHTLLLGSTRSGKSNTGGLIIENVHSLPDPFEGGCAVPLAIIDFQGEYKSIFDIYPENVHFVTEIIDESKTHMEEVGKNKFEEVYESYGKRDAQDFCAGRITYHFSVAPFNGEMHKVRLYLLDFLTECNNIKTRDYLELQKSSPGTKPRSHVFYFSEAHNFFPQEMMGDKSQVSMQLKRIGIAIAKGGLKLGMPCIFDSQRPSSFEKEISTQCVNRILLPVIDRPDLEYYASLLPYIGFTDLKIKMDEMWQHKGRAIFRTPSSTKQRLDTVDFFKKKSMDLGGTPDFASAIKWRRGGQGNSDNQAMQEEDNATPHSEDDPYKILQVDRAASNAQIKSAWKRQIRAWHPDNFPNDPDMAAEAEARSKNINQAMDRIKKERGIN